MALTRYDIDYRKLQFNASSIEHQRFIQQEITEFNARFLELNNYDKRTGWLAGMIGCVWLFGTISSMSALFVCTTYACASHEFFGRPEYAKHFQDQLSKLVELYEWCIQSAGKTITTNHSFLTLLETIAPFVEMEILKNPLKDWKNISKQYGQIMLKQPIHAARFESEKNEDDKGWFDSLWSTGNKAVTVKSSEKQEAVGHMRAGFTFSMYGRRLHPTSTFIERGKELLEPVLTLRNAIK